MPQFFPAANPLPSFRRRPSPAAFPATRSSSASNSGSRSSATTRCSTCRATSRRSAARTPMKAGLFVEHTTRPAARTSSFNGTYSFNTDASNPLNTNVGFANGLLGAITEYTESDGHPSAHGQFLITEWYAQDSWRVKRNVTLDAGRPLLLHDADAKRRRSASPRSSRAVEQRAGAETVSAGDDATGTLRAESLDRRDSSRRLHRQARAGLWQLHQRHAGLRWHAADGFAVPCRAAPLLCVGRDRRSAERRCAVAPACSTIATPTTSSST